MFVCLLLESCRTETPSQQNFEPFVLIQIKVQYIRVTISVQFYILNVISAKFKRHFSNILQFEL